MQLASPSNHYGVSEFGVCVFYVNRLTSDQTIVIYCKSLWFKISLPYYTIIFYKFDPCFYSYLRATKKGLNVIDQITPQLMNILHDGTDFNRKLKSKQA